MTTNNKEIREEFELYYADMAASQIRDGGAVPDKEEEWEWFLENYSDEDDYQPGYSSSLQGLVERFDG